MRQPKVARRQAIGLVLGGASVLSAGYVSCSHRQSLEASTQNDMAERPFEASGGRIGLPPCSALSAVERHPGIA